MPATVLALLSSGMFRRVLSTRLALVPRILLMVAICTASSFSCRPLDIRYNSLASFHSFHASARLRLSISNSEGGLRGPPRKNQTKMNFFRQGSKIVILSIFADK